MPEQVTSLTERVVAQTASVGAPIPEQITSPNERLVALATDEWSRFAVGALIRAQTLAGTQRLVALGTLQRASLRCA
jgi:hypothetical protein